jgi:predicted dehydrogenase
MRNNAAHSIEQIMDLAESDEMPQITSHLAIWNSVGDAEDYMFCRMHYSNGTIYEMEVNPSDAFAGEQPLFKIFGTKGTMKVYNAKIVYKYYKDEEVPTPVLDHYSLHKADGTPAYCNNQLVWHEEEVALQADVWNAFGKCTNRFYHAWYETLVNGAELFMKPEHIKAQIAIFNEIERQNPLISKYEKPADLV